MLASISLSFHFSDSLQRPEKLVLFIIDAFKNNFLGQRRRINDFSNLFSFKAVPSHFPPHYLKCMLYCLSAYKVGSLAPAVLVLDIFKSAEHEEKRKKDKVTRFELLVDFEVPFKGTAVTQNEDVPINPFS